MIQNIFENNGFKTEILAASFKNSNQVQELCAYGVGAATVAPDVIENLIKNACVTTAVEDFIIDFEKLCGKEKTMLDCDK
jgi:transaldolase